MANSQAARDDFAQNWRHIHFGEQKHTDPFHTTTDCAFVLRDVGAGYITIGAQNYRMHSNVRPSVPELPLESALLEALMAALAKEQRLTKVKLEETRIYTRGMKLDELAERVKQEVDGIWELCRPKETAEV